MGKGCSPERALRGPSSGRPRAGVASWSPGLRSCWNLLGRTLGTAGEAKECQEHTQTYVGWDHFPVLISVALGIPWNREWLLLLLARAELSWGSAPGGSSPISSLGGFGVTSADEQGNGFAWGVGRGVRALLQVPSWCQSSAGASLLHPLLRSCKITPPTRHSWISPPFHTTLLNAFGFSSHFFLKGGFPKHPLQIVPQIVWSVPSPSHSSQHAE